MPVVALAATLICALLQAPLISAASVHPATPETVAGPAFKFGAPDKTRRGVVCEVPGSGADADVEAAHKSSLAATHYMRAVPSLCVGPLCLGRYNAAHDPPNNGSVPRLRIIGRVIDTSGRPVPAGEVEIWQTDAAGAYGDLTPGREDGYCRARILTDSDGAFAIETSPPGAYGIMMGALGGGWEVPPIGPQHIHAMITHPSWAAASAKGIGSGVYAAQWYLPDDEAAQVHDAREALSLRSLKRWLPAAWGGKAAAEAEATAASNKSGVRPEELGTGSGHPALQLRLEPCSRSYRAEWRQIMRGHQQGHGLLAGDRDGSAAGSQQQPSLCARIDVVVPDTTTGGRRARESDVWAAGEREARIADVVCKQAASPVAVCRPQLLYLYRQRFLRAATAGTAVAVVAALLWGPLTRVWLAVTKRVPTIRVH